MAGSLLGVFLGIILLMVRGSPAVGVAQDEARCRAPVRVDVGSGNPFIWRVQPGLEPVARALAARRELLRPFPGIGSVISSLPAAPTVWMLEDLACLPALGLAGGQPDWVAGVASAGANFIVLRADRSRGDLLALPATYRHEAAHLALATATAGRAPRWLQEGYAQYAAGAFDWQDAWRLRFALFSTGADLFGELSLSFPLDAERARLAYLLSYTAVHELVGLGGEKGLASFFAQLRIGASPDEAMRRVFGRTESQFQQRWRTRVRQRYGILYLLSRASLFWVILTFLLLWLGHRRRRRDQARMRELRDTERREEARQESASSMAGVEGFSR